MPRKSTPPSIASKAFDCPYCGTFTSHTWFDSYAEEVTINDGVPYRPPVLIGQTPPSPYIRLESIQISRPRGDSRFFVNLNLSQCFACKKIATWVNGQPIFPRSMQTEPPNEDLPQEVRADYDEAGRIVNVSPRGAAALLRLAIQKLCINLGEDGKNINNAIASLVKKGLLPHVQQSLDAVRVTGNEAVHPGTMNLEDDSDTANALFSLVNIIADQMISHPKQAAAAFAKIPENKKQAIENRDA